MRIISFGFHFAFYIIVMNVQAKEIYGDWIKTKIEHVDKTELPNENLLKVQYLKYTFEKPNAFFMSLNFADKGADHLFARTNDILQIKNSFGYIINTFLIDKLTATELVLIQKGVTGFNENDCIKIYFTIENQYQKKLSVNSSDILLISNGDTVFRSCDKIHPEFKWKKSFYDFCSENMPERKAVMATNNYFLATFIIRKTGTIDSIKIIENINDRFAKQFLKTLDKSERYWRPGKLNGKKVDVQMKVSFRFISSDKVHSLYDFSQKGKNAMRNFDFSRALYYFNLVIDKSPEDFDILYYKAICETYLGNRVAACEDLKKVAASGKLNVDELISKECR